MTEALLTELQVETLIEGGAPVDPALLPVSGWVEELRRLGSPEPSSELVTRIGAVAAEIARESSPGEHVRQQSGLFRWFRAPAFAAAAAGFLLVLGSTGVAVAADAAAPGDALYGLDQAMERVGILDGGVAERLSEAKALAARGDTDAALLHAGWAFDSEGESEAASSLEDTAERLRGLGPENVDQDVTGQVADMLDWMATTSQRGRDFGEGVAERAREIGSDKANGNDQTQSGENQGSRGSNGSAPGQAKKNQG